MTDTRPAIVGMNNPLSSDPRLALYPHPPRCAGWNLWRMLAEAGERRGLEITRLDYAVRFDRRNVLSALKWSRADARAAGETLWSSLAGRRAVVLGVSTADALRLPRAPWGVWQHIMPGILPYTEPARWVLLPHPSGRCREYNDPAMREKTGDLLLELYLAAQRDGH